MTQREPTQDLGAVLLALRMAAESYRDEGKLTAKQAHAVQRAVNQAELRSRQAAEEDDPQSVLDELEEPLAACCGTELASLLLDEADRFLTDHQPPAAPAGDPRDDREAVDASLDPDAEEEPGGALASFLASHNRAVLLSMAIVLVLGGAVAMALATWRDPATTVDLLFCVVPLAFFAVARFTSSRLGLTRTGHPLFVITLLLIPPAAVATARGQPLLGLFAFVILAYLGAAASRWALGRAGQGLTVGLIAFSASTIFHDQMAVLLGEGTIYLQGTVYALLMAYDFTRRLAREKAGYPIVPVRVLPYLAVLSYAAAITILHALLLLQDEVQGRLEFLAPVALLVAAPGYFHGSLMYSRAQPGAWGRLVGATIAFASLVCTCLSLVLTLLKGVPLLGWSGIVTMLFVFAAVTFRVQWAHLGTALGATVFCITAIFMHRAGLGVDYPWRALPLEVAAWRMLPMVYALLVAGMLLEVKTGPPGLAYLQVGMALTSALVVVATVFGGLGQAAAAVCLALTVAPLALGIWRGRPGLVAIAGLLLYLAGTGWASQAGQPEPFHRALVVVAGVAVAFRACAWLAPPGYTARTPFVRTVRVVAAGGSILLALSVLGVATVFFHCAGRVIFDPSYTVAVTTQGAITLTLVIIGLGLAIPRPLFVELPRGALFIAAAYFLIMWMGVFLVTDDLLVYWQVTACALSALMAFGIGVRLPGVIPVAMITVMPALGLSTLSLMHVAWQVLPPPTLVTCGAVLVAGVIFLRGAAALESQVAYYLGTMTTSGGAIWSVVHVLPEGLQGPAVAVVAASVATVMAVWWTLCATRGWVRPVRFLRAALDSGVLCSFLAAVCLIAYLGLMVSGTLTAGQDAGQLPVAIRLAAIGVALALVAYYVGAAAAFKSELMVYVAEIAFFGAATLLRFGFRDIFREEQLQIWLPYIVVVLGFLFAGISEFLRRRGLAMFSRPLGITGVFLPVIPLLAMWTALATGDPEAPMGGFGAAQDHRAFVVGSAGLFYLVASNIRRNRTFTLIAAILFNLAVWFLYSFFQLRFQDLPQLLAVPVGLSIVLAAQVNSDRLSPRVLRNLRYLGLLVIYLSSAYKMFLAKDLIHAIILTVLSVLGGVIGMALRIRAFVYLGVTFLVFTVVGRILQIAEGGKIAWGIFTVTLGLALLLLITLMERHDRRQAEQGSPSKGAARPPSSTHQ